MNILLVDDDESIRNSWLEYSKTVGKELCEQNAIEIIPCANVVDAEKTLKEMCIDFLSVDLRLGSSEPEGNTLIKTVIDYSLRIPTIVITATPGDVIEQSNVLRTYKKGEDDDISDIIQYLISIYNTGITEILGRKGFLETSLNSFYKDFFIPNIEKWINRQAKDKDRVKRALMKIALNNLNSLLDYDEDKAYSEQVYLYFIDKSNFYTGSLLRNRETQDTYVVISPSCDIFLRKDKQGTPCRNVEIVHLLRINKAPQKMNASNEKDYKANKINRYHFLPAVTNFAGGFIDFADISIVPEENINTQYEIMKLRISEPFMKNISGRFSSYFGRQGQPDLDFEV